MHTKLKAYVIGLTEDKGKIEEIIDALEKNGIEILCWLNNDHDIKKDNIREFEYWNDVSHAVIWVASNNWNNLLQSNENKFHIRKLSFESELLVAIERKKYWELHGKKEYVRCYCLTLERLENPVAEICEKFASTRYYNQSNINVLASTINKQQNNMSLNKQFKSLIASDICSKTPETYSLSNPLHELYDAFLQKKFRHFPIVDSKNNLKAFLSITDLYNFFPFSNRIYDFLNRKSSSNITTDMIEFAHQEFNIKLRSLFRVSIEDAIPDLNKRLVYHIEANAQMPEIIEKFTSIYKINGKDRYLRCFPVLDKSMDLIGVLSYIDILKIFKSDKVANILSVKDLAYIGEVTYISDNDTLNVAKNLLHFSPFRHLPIVGKKVVDKKGREIETVIGMIDDYILSHNYKEQIEATHKIPVDAVMDKIASYDDIIRSNVLSDDVIPQLNGNESIKSLIEEIYMKDNFKTKEGFPICVPNGKIEGMITYINILKGIKDKTNLLR
jgi:CBS domain-containing protein